MITVWWVLIFKDVVVPNLDRYRNLKLKLPLRLLLRLCKVVVNVVELA